MVRTKSYRLVYATCTTIKKVVKDIDGNLIQSISFSGQMHGLVALDKDNQVIRPAILWNDSRSEKETQQLNNVFGKKKLLKETGNIAFPGFTAPKLLWMKKNESDNFNRINIILLPKDYLAYKFSKVFATDVSDASGTLYFDVKNKRWSKKILNYLGISSNLLPQIYESNEQIGTIDNNIAKELNINLNTKIVIGGADNACSAFGNNIVNKGDCNISLGTSGTIFVVNDRYSCDTKNAIHSFRTCSQNYCLMSCILSCGVCLKWWKDNILKCDDFSIFNIENKDLGNNKVYFLPYLMGERSPYNDTKVRAMFYGMDLTTETKHLCQALLEGVAFALKDNLVILEQSCGKITSTTVSGGLCKNTSFLTILANVLNVKLNVLTIEEGASIGSALLASQSFLNEKDFNSLRAKLTQIKTTIEPTKELVNKYETCYKTFKKFYKAVKTFY